MTFAKIQATVEEMHHQYGSGDIEISGYIGYVHVSLFSSSLIMDLGLVEMALARVWRWDTGGTVSLCAKSGTMLWGAVLLIGRKYWVAPVDT